MCFVCVCVCKHCAMYCGYFFFMFGKMNNFVFGFFLVWICSRSGGLWRLEEWHLWTMGRSMEDLLSLSILSTRIGYVFLFCCSLFMIAFVFIIHWNCMFWVKFYVAMIKGTNNYMPQQEKKKSNGLRKIFVIGVW